jgi:hypothetical protein
LSPTGPSERVIGMRVREVIRRLPLAGAGVAGAAVGHSIAYLIVAPQGRTRAALLAGTGHGYRSTLAAAEIVLGLLAVLMFLGRHFHRGLRSPRRPASEEPWAWLAARLALLQITIFAVQEIVERAAVGYPIGGLATDRLLSIGVPVQIVVAVGVATLLVCLGRAAEAVGRVFGRPRLPRPVRVAIARPRAAGRLASRPGRACGIRAPPHFRIA